ncbi:hypothetical protein UFOVP139_17 [uncultured Caudovirales phage]|uniref:Uncharacterized protein n=1 Tax=uncultured Caudovirales phage TaxID=2100421 RepID=A0A6J5LF13_9CAUD|nr:hypothetical protein UFOVP139_17 [uncultured Caudovirales phage]
MNTGDLKVINNRVYVVLSQTDTEYTIQSMDEERYLLTLPKESDVG